MEPEATTLVLWRWVFGAFVFGKGSVQRINEQERRILSQSYPIKDANLRPPPKQPLQIFRRYRYLCATVLGPPFAFRPPGFLTLPPKPDHPAIPTRNSARNIQAL